MGQLLNDIVLAEGNNELNVEMAPIIGAAEFAYVSGIRQIQYESDPGQTWSRHKLRAEIDVKNVSNVAGVCTCTFQIACAEGDWAWSSHPELSQATLQPGEIVTFTGDVLDSPRYGYTCKCRFTGDPGTTDEVPMI